MRTIQRREFLAMAASVTAFGQSLRGADVVSKDEARTALEKAVAFFVDTIAGIFFFFVFFLVLLLLLLPPQIPNQLFGRSTEATLWLGV